MSQVKYRANEIHRYGPQRNSASCTFQNIRWWKSNNTALIASTADHEMNYFYFERHMQSANSIFCRIRLTFVYKCQFYNMTFSIKLSYWMSLLRRKDYVIFKWQAIVFCIKTYFRTHLKWIIFYYSEFQRCIYMKGSLIETYMFFSKLYQRIVNENALTLQIWSQIFVWHMLFYTTLL